MNLRLDAPLSAIPHEVDQCVADFFHTSSADFGYISPDFSHALSVLQNFILNGGKRVRPTFAWAGLRAACEGGGASLSLGDDANPRHFLRAVSALEFIQACALIHDDIIDQSDTRRGAPTVHRVFEQQHREQGWRGDAEHYGISQAILTGDLALSWADDMLRASGLSAEVLARAREPWRAMRTEVIAGQQLDIAAEHRAVPSVRDAFIVISFKTASYTVERPLHVGAALAGADGRTIELLRSYGRQVGTAFQLRDDMLGVFGDPHVTGKPSGDDLRTGKGTVLVNWALRESCGADQEFLHEHLGAPGLSQQEVDRMCRIVREVGAADYVENQIAELTDAAISSVQNSWLGEEISAELVSFATKLGARRF